MDGLKVFEKLTKNKDYGIILASASPRRVEIMRTYGFNPKVLVSSYDETLPFPMNPKDLVMFYSMGKALDVAKKLERKNTNKTPIVIGSDTVVCKGDEIFEKPRNKEDGFRMLSALRNSSHSVISGVCIAIPTLPLIKVFYEVTNVTFSNFSDKELSDYLDTPEAYDKSGGYAIQGTFKKYVKKIHGDINNVVGFPMDRFLNELSKIKL